jgi:hypothetical protein
MATIKSGDSTTQLSVDATSKAARVSLYDPATGLPMASYIRGTGFDLDTSANVDMRDAIALAVPGAGGAQIAGTSSVPLRTDPTGTTTQPVSGTVAVSNLPATQPVSGTVTVANPVNAVQVNNFPATQTVTGTVTANGSMAITNFPGTQTVAGTVTVSNLPATQAVTGTVNANVRTGGSDVSAANPLKVDAVGTVVVSNDDTDPVSVKVLNPDYGYSYAISLDIVPTTLADGTVYWAMRNNGTRMVYLKRVSLQQGFTGTAAASRSSFSLVRFTGTPSGGTTMPSVKKISTQPTAGATFTGATAGLTATSMTFDTGIFHRVSSPNQLNTQTSVDMDYGTNEAAQFNLAPGEGICLRAAGAVVSGVFISGSIGWHER